MRKANTRFSVKERSAFKMHYLHRTQIKQHVCPPIFPSSPSVLLTYCCGCWCWRRCVNASCLAGRTRLDQPVTPRPLPGVAASHHAGPDTARLRDKSIREFQVRGARELAEQLGVPFTSAVVAQWLASEPQPAVSPHAGFLRACFW
jgi:hypothetical protein